MYIYIVNMAIGWLNVMFAFNFSHSIEVIIVMQNNNHLLKVNSAEELQRSYNSPRPIEPIQIHSIQLI